MGPFTNLFITFTIYFKRLLTYFNEYLTYHCACFVFRGVRGNSGRGFLNLQFPIRLRSRRARCTACIAVYMSLSRSSCEVLKHTLIELIQRHTTSVTVPQGSHASWQPTSQRAASVQNTLAKKNRPLTGSTSTSYEV